MGQRTATIEVLDGQEVESVQQEISHVQDSCGNNETDKEE